MDLEEERQNVAVAGLLRIENDFQRLGVARVPTIGGVAVRPARVADPGLQDAGLTADQVLHAPETPTGQDCRLGAGHAGDLAGVVDTTGHSAFSLVVSVA